MEGDAMAKREKEDLKELFEETKKQVAGVLANTKFLDIGGGKLHFINKEQGMLLNAFRAGLEERIESNSDKKRYGFGLIAKLLNPLHPAQYYYAGMKGRHRQINDSLKVLKNLDGEFAVWQNKIRKDAREYAATHSLDDEAIALLEADIARSIERGTAHFEYMKSDFDNLSVKITGYKHEKSYPYVSYRIDGKLAEGNISIKVPTVLLFEPVKYRSDMSEAEFIKNAVHAFGDVYYMIKE